MRNSAEAFLLAGPRTLCNRKAGRGMPWMTDCEALRLTCEIINNLVPTSGVQNLTFFF